jgi:hypothetical protein
MMPQHIEYPRHAIELPEACDGIQLRVFDIETGDKVKCPLRSDFEFDSRHPGTSGFPS